MYEAPKAVVVLFEEKTVISASGCCHGVNPGETAESVPTCG